MRLHQQNSGFIYNPERTDIFAECSGLTHPVILHRSSGGSPREANSRGGSPRPPQIPGGFPLKPDIHRGSPRPLWGLLWLLFMFVLHSLMILNDLTLRGQCVLEFIGSLPQGGIHCSTLR